MAEVFRTSDERFRDLPGYPFAPRYLEGLAPGVRVHYLDEGPPDAAETFLCLHGEPTWSYLYRKMIPVFTAAGHRVVAPDLIGFGKSDKYTDKRAYDFALHRGMLLHFIERLDMRRLTLVCQDWGGVLGLTLPLELPERFERLLVMNTALATGDHPLPPAFLLWRLWARLQPNLNVGQVLRLSTPHLTAAEVAAYDAPFPTRASKAGAHVFPSLVPTRPGHEGAEISRRARDWWRKEWKGRTFMAIGTDDPILGLRAMRSLQRNIRNCPEPWLIKTGHFVQERGEEVAREALASYARAR